MPFSTDSAILFLRWCGPRWIAQVVVSPPFGLRYHCIVIQTGGPRS